MLATERQDRWRERASAADMAPFADRHSRFLRSDPDIMPDMDGCATPTSSQAH